MNYIKEWEKILNYIGSAGIEIGTYTIINRTKNYFKVNVDNENLIISRSEKLQPSCKININRRITYKQFEEVYNLYERFINREKGVRQQMTKLSNNSTYIISIIHEIL